MRWRNLEFAGRGRSANVPDSEGGKAPTICVGLADGFLQVAEILPYTCIKTVSLQDCRPVLPLILITRAGRKPMVKRAPLCLPPLSALIFPAVRVCKGTYCSYSLDKPCTASPASHIVFERPTVYILVQIVSNLRRYQIQAKHTTLPNFFCCGA